jgi:hypothetical protein
MQRAAEPARLIVHGMPRSTLSVFSEPNDFEVALVAGGCIDLVVSSNCKFRASLTWIRLNRMELAAGEERQSRVAFVSIPPRSVRVTLPPAFEGLIRASPTKALSTSDIGASLGVSATTLRKRCRAHLGMALSAISSCVGWNWSIALFATPTMRRQVSPT